MSLKRSRSEVGNLDDEGEPFFQSPTFKEVKTHESNEGFKIDLKAEGHHMDEERMDSYEDRESAAQMKRLREKFYDFHSKHVARVNTKHFFSEVKRDLLLKIDQVLDNEAISEYYEKILQRTAFTVKPAKRVWTEEENLLLVSIVTYLCKTEEKDFTSLNDSNWDYVANFFPGRKQDQLKLQWLSFLKTKLTQAPWTPFEDDMLKQIMKEKGRGNHWKEIASELNARCNSQVYRHGKQCRERWINHLDPAVSRGPWTDEEDLRMLKHYLNVGGKKWADIAKLMRDRTENSVKNRWNSLYKKFSHELGFESQSVHSLDSESDGAIERERRVTQKIIDHITKNFTVGGSLLDRTSGLPDQKEFSFSADKRFVDLHISVPENSYQHRKRSFSSGSLVGTKIVNKMNLLKDFVQDDRPYSPASDSPNFDNQNSAHYQNNSIYAKSEFREGSSQWNSTNNSATLRNGQSQSPLYGESPLGQSISPDSFGMMGMNGFPNAQMQQMMQKRMNSSPNQQPDVMKSISLIKKNNAPVPLSIRPTTNNPLGVIREDSLEAMIDNNLAANAEIDLSLKERNLREFKNQAGNLVGTNNLQFAVVDLTKSEVYFVNQVSQKNLQKSLAAMQGVDQDSHWGASPFLNFNGTPKNMVYVPAPANGAMLQQDFANMKISSEKKKNMESNNFSPSMGYYNNLYNQMDRPEQKESVKQFLDQYSVVRQASNPGMMGFAQPGQYVDNSRGQQSYMNY